jgi:hypothetical protein
MDVFCFSDVFYQLLDNTDLTQSEFLFFLNEIGSIQDFLLWKDLRY